ncbi:archaeoflavoprotein AfpA [Candidatus Bathyarchaeota archaeon]|nr:archaeoflavoprotein AfpA [Candidatus Bathyarchaeota archaeon]
MIAKKAKKRKVAWGITGGGDKIAKTIEIMKKIKEKYADKVEIRVFLSKAAETVLRFYRLEDSLRQDFKKVAVEMNSNTPFLAGWMQMGKFEFLLIAPTTSNTAAKIANGIGDSLLSNSAIMSLKAFVPIYLVPTDYREEEVYTELPNGKRMKLKIRKENVEHVRKLEHMEDVNVLEGPNKIYGVFEEWFG